MNFLMLHRVTSMRSNTDLEIFSHSIILLSKIMPGSLAAFLKRDYSWNTTTTSSRLSCLSDIADTNQNKALSQPLLGVYHNACINDRIKHVIVSLTWVSRLSNEKSGPIRVNICFTQRTIWQKRETEKKEHEHCCSWWVKAKQTWSKAEQRKLILHRT